MDDLWMLNFDAIYLNGELSWKLEWSNAYDINGFLSNFKMCCDSFDISWNVGLIVIIAGEMQWTTVKISVFW